SASTSGSRTPERFTVADTLFDAGLQNQWQDYGWAPRELKSGPAKINFAKYGGWIIAKPGLKGRFGGITFRLKMPQGEGEFLEVRLDSAKSAIFPRIKVSPEHRVDLGDGWTEVFIPMAQLNPEGRTFDRVIFRAFREVPADWMLLDKVALVAP